MMMCKCCDGGKADCNCMHHKMPMLCGFGIAIVGILLLLTNYGVLPVNIWAWLFPVALILGGIHHMMMCGMRQMDDCKMAQCKKPDDMMKK